MDLRIQPYDTIQGYDPEDISLALNGYGPEEFQKELQTFVKRYGKSLTAGAIARILGVSFDDLPKTRYGKYNTQAVIILKPSDEAEADALKYTTGLI